MDDIRTSSRSIAFVTYFSIASLLNYLCQFWFIGVASGKYSHEIVFTS